MPVTINRSRRGVPRATFTAQPTMSGGDASSGLRALGAALRSAGANIETAFKKRDDFAVSMALIQQESALLQQFQQAKVNAPLGAPEFVEQTQQGLEGGSQQILGQAQGLSTDAQRKLRLGLENLNQEFTVRAINFQADSQKALFQQAMGEAGDELSRLAQANPDKLPEYIERAGDIIDNNPLLVDSIERDRVKDIVKTQLEAAAYTALARQDPERVIAEVEGAAPGPTNSLISSGDPRGLLRDFEGFRETPYWDVNAYRVGYGSDTITRADGTVVKVEPGMRVTRLDAERDLARRTREFENTAIGQVGVDRWASLPGNVRAPLISVAYNYGSLPKSVVRAVKSGDVGQIANAVESLSANPGRRKKEAAVIRGSTVLPDGGPDPVLGNLSAADRERALSLAESEMKEIRTSERASLANDLANAEAAFSNGLAYDGAPITEERFMRAYEDIEQATREWEAFKMAERVGGEVQKFKTSPNEELLGVLEEKPPQDTSGEFYELEDKMHEARQQAASAILQERAEEPYEATVTAFPSLETLEQQAMDSQAPLAVKRQFYSQLEAAYDTLGVPLASRTPFDSQTIQTLEGAMERATAEETFALAVEMYQSMPEDMFYNGIRQMEEEGMGAIAYAAAFYVNSPDHRNVIMKALKGHKLLTSDDSSAVRAPTKSAVTEAVNAHMGAASIPLNRSIDGVIDLARALYFVNGGAPAEADFDETLFNQGLNKLLGGTDDTDNTGIVDMSKGSAQYKTILPPLKTKGEFKRAVSKMDRAMFEAYGGGYTPMYADMETVATPEDIVDEGVFLRVSQNEYEIIMGSDGGTLQTPMGQPYRITLTPDIIDGINSIPTVSSRRPLRIERDRMRLGRERMRRGREGAPETPEPTPPETPVEEAPGAAQHRRLRREQREPPAQEEPFDLLRDVIRRRQRSDASRQR